MEEDGAFTEELYNYGMSLNPSNDRVQCNYCGSKVAGFDALRIHLIGTIGESPECKDVPASVKKLLKEKLNMVEDKNLKQEAESFCKAESTPNSKENSTPNRKRGKTGFQNDGPKDSKRATVNRINSKARASDLHGESAEQKMFPKREGRLSSSVMTKRLIGRFLIENAIDFDAVKSYSFRKMIEAMSDASDITSHIPSIQELKGWIFSDELKETKNCVDGIKDSWSRTGCSVVLDGWVDDRGRNLLMVVVDCPLGAVYIDSFDISTLVENVEGFVLFLESVLEEIGIQNVVQIISHTSSDFMTAVGKHLMEKHRSLFWSVSVSHCVALMLEKIALVDSVKQVLDKAKTVTRFIYGQEDALKLMRSHTGSSDLIKTSNIKATMPFLTLENILFEKKNLKNLVSSSEWIKSSWASNVKAKRVSDLLLHDKSFWDRIKNVVKATIPLVKALALINGDGDANVGFIYETMDQVKETISDELESEKAPFELYWNIIDDIWDNILHIPLHAAGYFLNPRFYYTEDFCADSEVAGDLFATIVKIVEDLRTQDLISMQLDVYKGCEDNFKKGIENEKQNNISPAAWWSSFGSHCPDLQKLAIRVLSQSCNGAESYGLKKDVAEKLLCNGIRNQAEKQQLSDVVYIHYNMNLKHKKLGAKCDVEVGGIGSNCDWIMDEDV